MQDRRTALGGAAAVVVGVVEVMVAGSRHIPVAAGSIEGSEASRISPLAVVAVRPWCVSTNQREAVVLVRDQTSNAAGLEEAGHGVARACEGVQKQSTLSQPPEPRFYVRDASHLRHRPSH